MEATEVVQELLSAMEMQEKRETGEFHITQPVAKQIWDEAKDKAVKFIHEQQTN